MTFDEWWMEDGDDNAVGAESWAQAAWAAALRAKATPEPTCEHKNRYRYVGTPFALKCSDCGAVNCWNSGTKEWQPAATARLYPASPEPKALDLADESDGALLTRLGTDAAKWAADFKRRFGDNVVDEGTMLGWFANAIMAGHDAALRAKGDTRPDYTLAPVRRASGIMYQVRDKHGMICGTYADRVNAELALTQLRQIEVVPEDMWVCEVCDAPTFPGVLVCDKCKPSRL